MFLEQHRKYIMSNAIKTLIGKVTLENGECSSIQFINVYSSGQLTRKAAITINIKN